MDKHRFFYITWQCIIVLVCGITGMVGLFIQTTLSPDVALLFTIVFILCILTALFFLVWIRLKRKEEKENNLIDSIGEPE